MVQTITRWWKLFEAQVQRIEPPQARRLVVALVGSTVLLLGLAMLLLPGPAFVVIPAGLAILALEFRWARVWLDHVTEFAKRAATKVAPAAMARAERDAHQRAREARQSY